MIGFPMDNEMFEQLEFDFSYEEEQYAKHLASIAAKMMGEDK